MPRRKSKHPFIPKSSPYNTRSKNTSARTKKLFQKIDLFTNRRNVDPRHFTAKNRSYFTKIFTKSIVRQLESCNIILPKTVNIQNDPILEPERGTQVHKLVSPPNLNHTVVLITIHYDGLDDGNTIYAIHRRRTKAGSFTYEAHQFTRPVTAAVLHQFYKIKIEKTAMICLSLKCIYDWDGEPTRFKVLIENQLFVF